MGDKGDMGEYGRTQEGDKGSPVLVKSGKPSWLDIVTTKEFISEHGRMLDDVGIVLEFSVCCSCLVVGVGFVVVGLLVCWFVVVSLWFVVLFGTLLRVQRA